MSQKKIGEGQSLKPRGKVEDLKPCKDAKGGGRKPKKKDKGELTPDTGPKMNWDTDSEKG